MSCISLEEKPPLMSGPYAHTCRRIWSSWGGREVYTVQRERFTVCCPGQARWPCYCSRTVLEWWLCRTNNGAKLLIVPECWLCWPVDCWNVDPARVLTLWHGWLCWSVDCAGLLTAWSELHQLLCIPAHSSLQQIQQFGTIIILAKSTLRKSQHCSTIHPSAQSTLQQSQHCSTINSLAHLAFWHSQLFGTINNSALSSLQHTLLAASWHTTTQQHDWCSELQHIGHS